MAKKKKEVCAYCGKSFAYLSRHKCKIKERIEGVEDDKSVAERRIERIEEKKKDIKRSLKKDEKEVLKIINKEKDIFFNDLMNLTNKNRLDLEEILDILVLQSKIKMSRELLNAAWSKHIFAIENYEDEVNIDDIAIDKKKKDFIWNLFSRQPCFICPFTGKCNETNLDNFNPNYCIWLTEWMKASVEGRDFYINFDEFQEDILD